MPRPVHFEIHASDPARAQTFYSGLFGWEFTAWGPPGMYWLIKTGTQGPGIDGGLVPRRGDAPGPMAAVNGFVCTVNVDSVDQTFAQALKTGGSEALPKMPIPGVGWLAYIKDTEGNILGLMQNDPGAK
ncbi:MAG: VOC family protein [Deltaproteobacteria bacterium]|nr:VOC family protein [Deltaproteobacteria bacterium]